MKTQTIIITAALALALLPLPLAAEEAEAAGTVAEAAQAATGNAWWNTRMIPFKDAWDFGVYGSWVNNWLNRSGIDYYSSAKWESADGWSIGLIARYRFYNWLAVQIEPGYITKNYRLKWQNMKNSGVALDFWNLTENGFLEFPIMANISQGWTFRGSPGRDFTLRIFVNAGVFLGAWLYGRETGLANSLDNSGRYYVGQQTYDKAYEFDDTRDNRFDGGLLAGLGLEFSWGKTAGFFVEGRYEYSLSDMQKPYQSVVWIPQHNSTWQLRAGVLVNSGIFGGN
jgi:hypothetical protein